MRQERIGKNRPRTDRPLVRISEILLVDDNPASARLLREALKDGLVRCRVTAVEDGERALALLRGEGAYTLAVRPDLILLDLNLPKINGHELLATLKADPTLRSIPVIILTTSQAEEDKALSYLLGADRFLVKPKTWDGYQRVIKTIVTLLARM